MSRYAVIGYPVSHSKSPRIHRMFAAQTGEALEYSAIEVAPEELSNFVDDFFSQGGAGLNVTLPHKEAVFALAQSLTERAERAGAANTLFLDANGRLCGDNTDGVGLLRDLKNNHRLTLTKKNILLLGAGGAIRGIIAALATEDPASMTIANRTLARAVNLQQQFGELLPIEISDYAALQSRDFDFIINGTSLGVHGEVPPLKPDLIGPDCCCYDLMYADRETAFVSWAKAQGAKQAIDGLGMLVEQAAESFFVWRGIRPDTSPVINQLRTTA